MEIKDLGAIQLWRLRKDVTLNSCLLKDYENRYGVDPKEAYVFFMGWLDYLEECMKDDIPDYKSDDFFNYLDQYDTKKNLLEWWFCWVG